MSKSTTASLHHALPAPTATSGCDPGTFVVVLQDLWWLILLNAKLRAKPWAEALSAACAFYQLQALTYQCNRDEGVLPPHFEQSQERRYAELPFPLIAQARPLEQQSCEIGDSNGLLSVQHFPSLTISKTHDRHVLRRGRPRPLDDGLTPY
ncbi:hypothetical protein Efla_000781 [Eimeria flavescens]